MHSPLDGAAVGVTQIEWSAVGITHRVIMLTWLSLANRGHRGLPIRRI